MKYQIMLSKNPQFGIINGVYKEIPAFVPSDYIGDVCSKCDRFSARKIIHLSTGVITNDLCIFCVGGSS